jgi:hypothetical protein
MRFAITLDDDLATMLHEEMERSGETFKQVVNRMLRLGINEPTNSKDKTVAKSPKLPA